MQREKKFTKTQQKAFLQQAYPNGHFYGRNSNEFLLEVFRATILFKRNLSIQDLLQRRKTCGCVRSR